MLPYIFLSINFLFALLIFFLVLAFITGAPYVPTTNKAAAAMMKLSHIKKGTRVYDLGSGDGKLLLLAASQGAYTSGFEINPFLVMLSRIRILMSPYNANVKVYWKNFWSAELHGADVVFIYLLPWRMERLANFLIKQCKPGAIVVSNSFVFPHWKILRQDPTTHTYVFHVPPLASI